MLIKLICRLVSNYLLLCILQYYSNSERKSDHRGIIVVVETTNMLLPGIGSTRSDRNNYYNILIVFLR